MQSRDPEPRRKGMDWNRQDLQLGALSVCAPCRMLLVSLPFLPSPMLLACDCLIQLAINLPGRDFV
jgi:hypothetical protein